MRRARRACTLLLGAAVLCAACSHVVDERAQRRLSPREEFRDQVRRAASLHQQSLYDEAERRYVAALAAASSLPADDPELLTARVALALVYQAQGELGRAESELLAVLPIQRRATGDASEPVANVLNNLGAVQVDLRRYEEASRSLYGAFEIRRVLLGDDDPLTAVTLQNLASALRGLRQYEDALAAYEDAYDIYRAAGPSWDARAATVQNNLGLLYRELGLEQKAEVHHLAAIDITRRVNSARNPNLAIYSRDLAGLYAQQARFAEADERYRAALEMFERTLGPSSPQLRETLLEYRQLLLRMGRREEAAQVGARAAHLGAAR
jgi:tetratricopeptide (TPR) repeat protein